MRKSALRVWAVLLFLGTPSLRAEANGGDYFTPPETMYSFADFWVVRPMDLAVLPITAVTWVCSLPVTAASGTSERYYDLLIKEPTQHMMQRPLGSFFDWENRDQTRPVVIQFVDSYTMAELSPEQERKYKAAYKQHQERVLAIERTENLPEEDRKKLALGEEKRWENVVRLLLSL